MPRDIDEDLIEATIRRVAEAVAATRPPAEPDDATPAPDVLRDPSSADDTAAYAAEPAESEEEDARTLERLRFDDRGWASGPRRFSPEMPGGVPARPWSPPEASEEIEGVDEAPEAIDAGLAETQPADDGEAIETAATVEDLHERDDTPIAPQREAATVWQREPPAAWHRAPVQPAPVPDAATEGIHQALAEINGRLDSIVAMLESLSLAGARPSATWAAPEPRITAMPFRQEPVVRGATAPQFEPNRIDTRPMPPREPNRIDARPIPEPLPPLHVEPRRGLELLPRSYRITVEDKRQGVDLVPLHRALLGMDGVKDMSLMSYNNGVAIVALEMNGDIDPELLRSSISRAMQRNAQVEVHNESTLVVKLAQD